MQHIIDTYENKEAGKPAFIFNVTMQNHGGYTDVYPNFENDIQAQYNSDALNQYLSLIHKTDAALEDLVSYFSKADEKTVIVFFGDHQPSDAVANQIEMASGVDPSDMNSEQQKKRYQVPYLVWANYDIGEASDQNTSLNYLSAQVLKAAGVPTSAYQNYFLELSNTYPVLSAAGSTENVGANKDALLTYRKLQYYNLFERNK